MASDDPDPAPAKREDMTPEGRRRAALLSSPHLREELLERAGPGTRVYLIGKRVLAGVYQDGFIHAGNLAYMTLLSLFPFFIAVSAVFSAIGEQGQREASVAALLSAVPPTVSKVLGPVAYDVITSREGWLLWIGGLFGVWTASALIETIREILHRAYGTAQSRAFWQYRLLSAGIIFGSVLLLLVSLAAQVVLSSAQELISQAIPQLSGFVGGFIITKMIGGAMLFASLYLLFFGLTPHEYQSREYPKWPGVLLVAVWWLAVTAALPRVISQFFSYDLTYGSLAGVMVALFFFWLVGLGVVVGAELNAALAITPEEHKVAEEVGDEERIASAASQETEQ